MSRKKCSQCGIEVENSKKFCSNSCSAKYNNRLRKIKPYPNCKYCSKQLSNRIKKYCNNRCQGDYKREFKTLPAFYKGEISQRATLVSIVTSIKGHICSKCNIETYNSREIVLELNHIDGNPFNDFPKNLELLCPNCHSQTDTFKGRNRGNGRKLRK